MSEPIVISDPADIDQALLHLGEATGLVSTMHGVLGGAEVIHRLTNALDGATSSLSRVITRNAYPIHAPLGEPVRAHELSEFGWRC